MQSLIFPLVDARAPPKNPARDSCSWVLGLELLELMIGAAMSSDGG